MQLHVSGEHCGRKFGTFRLKGILGLALHSFVNVLVTRCVVERTGALQGIRGSRGPRDPEAPGQAGPLQGIRGSRNTRRPALFRGSGDIQALEIRRFSADQGI